MDWIIVPKKFETRKEFFAWVEKTAAGRKFVLGDVKAHFGFGVWQSSLSFDSISDAKKFGKGWVGKKHWRKVFGIRVL